MGRRLPDEGASAPDATGIAWWLDGSNKQPPDAGRLALLVEQFGAEHQPVRHAPPTCRIPYPDHGDGGPDNDFSCKRRRDALCEALPFREDVPTTTTTEAAA